MQQRVKIKGQYTFEEANTIIQQMMHAGFDVDAEYFKELNQWQIFGTRCPNVAIPENGSNFMLFSEGLSQETDEESISNNQDGWIEWQGGECPVSGSTRVEVILSDGCIDQDRADNLYWSSGLEHYEDIIKYRVIEKEEE